MSSRHNIRARIYIGRLPNRASERDVTKFFKPYGRIIDIQLKNGYGFVEFDDSRDADDAVHEMNGRDLCGERVIIEHAKGPPRSVVERERFGGGGGRYGRYDDRYRRRRSSSRDRRTRRRSRSYSRSRSRSPRHRRRDRHRSKYSRSRSRSSSRSRSRSYSRSPSRSRSRSRSISRSRSPQKDGGAVAYKIEVDNIPAGTSTKELEDFMAAAGKVTFCEINDEKGFVGFEDEASQAKALESLADVEFKEGKLTLTKGYINGKATSRSRSRSVSRGSSPEHAGAANGNGGVSKSRSRSRSSPSRSRSPSRSEDSEHDDEDGENGE